MDRTESLEINSDTSEIVSGKNIQLRLCEEARTNNREETVSSVSTAGKTGKLHVRG